MDTQGSLNSRKITAFIGGLDLRDGRYDTPQHRIFSDLDTTFLNDFYNPTFPVSIITLNFSCSIKLPDQEKYSYWIDFHLQFFIIF